MHIYARTHSCTSACERYTRGEATGQPQTKTSQQRRQVLRAFCRAKQTFHQTKAEHVSEQRQRRRNVSSARSPQLACLARQSKYIKTTHAHGAHYLNTYIYAYVCMCTDSRVSQGNTSRTQRQVPKKNLCVKF